MMQMARLISADRVGPEHRRWRQTFSYDRAAGTVSAAASTAYLDEVLKGVGKDNNQKLLEQFPVRQLPLPGEGM